jgi:hypothetical protein
MVFPSCTHPEHSASFAASAVKTQQPVEIRVPPRAKVGVGSG